MFELVGDDLGVRRVGGVLADKAARRGVYRLRMGLLGPPQELIHPMDAPIPESAVGEVENCRNPRGWMALLKGRLGAGPSQRSQSIPWADRRRVSWFRRRPRRERKSAPFRSADFAGLRNAIPVIG